MHTADPTILSDLSDIIRRRFRQPDAEVARSTVALDIDGWDSLAHTLLILDVEAHFHIILPVDRIFDLADVGELADLVAKVRGG